MKDRVEAFKNTFFFFMFTYIPFLSFFFPFPSLFFFLISWRLITLQYCSGFCHTLTWISHGFTCVPHPDHPSHLPPHQIPLGLPSAPGPSTCLMHPTWHPNVHHSTVYHSQDMEKYILRIIRDTGRCTLYLRRWDPHPRSAVWPQQCEMENRYEFPIGAH